MDIGDNEIKRYFITACFSPIVKLPITIYFAANNAELVAKKPTV